ncbi:MAG: PQQ-binding-like beta-propeller repeat protein [Actinophytocola sp.]|uniref:outer membrane protein assembly factor BamB family protein n=1 Tax=Actinophytocola sp. TaxID=1872138 RepID=UPI001324898D|nr:PQQ-binding-like beta-propeller repeat protein [Actinophytocola sp.]MPZ81108.1 PQQ-binding-like beta-propeller repeat protein [Actinophytocola sp.]
MQFSPTVRRKALALAAGLAALTTASCGVASSEPEAAADRGHRSSDWPTWQLDTVGSRYNANEREITPRNAGQLELKYAYTFGNVPYARVGSQPAVADGVLYVGGPDGEFVALDAKTGETRWSYDANELTGPLPDGAPNGIRDGAAVSGDKVYFGDSTGRIFALDKRSGKLRWAKKVSTQDLSAMTSSPLIVGNRLFVGVSTLEAGLARDPNYACCKHRGQVVALDTDTGDQIWEYYTMRPAEEVGTWPSGAKKYAPAGGSVWSSPVADLKSRTVFVGTGQNTTGSEGDINSVIALSMDTGKVRWKNRMTFPDTYTTACEQENPGDYCPGLGTTALDADFGASANVITVRGRTLVTIGQKNGMYYAFDARSGRVVWRNELAPGPHGGVGVQWGSVFDGRYLYAATWYEEPSTLYKIDAADGEIVWTSAHPEDGCTTGGAAAFQDMCMPIFTPAPTGSPGLIYEGSADGKFRIFSSRTGEVLYTFDAIRDFQGVNGVPGRGSALSGNGGAIVADGMVYVMAGYYPFYPTDKGTVMLAFGLK